MVFRLLILIFLLSMKIGYANIIYDKNEITITKIEMDNYKNLYKTNFDNEISNNEAIKNIVLIKKTISFLIKNNPNFLSVLDKNIKLEYGNEIFDNQVVLDFVRFQKIRNEFISEYFQNIFSIEDLKIIFSNSDNLKLPISKNNCLTIEKLHEVNSDRIFMESFFNKLKNKKQKITTIINNELYEVCLDNKSFQNLNIKIIKYIEIKTKDDFDSFIYRKNN